ncbi:hypothetical protein OIN60_21405 [Paenibacillus sp. P96]|uniref:Colicin import membrane protein n=1 Tax=Paenibacillus zeirhizosphaerae TaxID=2987519 RepID=A0ABT9FX16_9BACL|nr:hypothetical protein [Paenibacillus sp. P96]MDP4099276.1 hypothetical protein [Paenibacillus sp. P96]
MLVLLLVAALWWGSILPAQADSWEAALDGIDAVYDDVTELEALIKLESKQTQTLRQKNNDSLQALNKDIQAIDAALIARLTGEVKQIEQKHAALLSQYSSLSKQAAAARKQKNTKAAALLDLKRNNLKPSYTQAKAEIKAKKDALTAAKKQATTKKKAVKDALLPVTALKKQITAENKVIADARKSKTAANKKYRSAVKIGDAVTALTQMMVVYDQLARIHTSQQKTYTWEKKIAEGLAAAEAKLP